ncbi:MAG: PDDEXK nuclease domain-containing protein [Actinomycetota bacterium]|nr:PDDEXK nuclease domain-containing protein [Actinomycetota bacterium]
MSTSAGSGVVEPVGYAELLEQVKVRVRTSRVQAARAVNTELVGLYWQIGRLILDRQESEGWGSKVIGRLAADLRAEFPGMRGLSQRSLVYMRTFAAAVEAPIAQQPAAQLPWGHIMVLLDKVTDPEARQWYAAQSVEHGWSRAVLTHHIATNRHVRVGAAPNNFPTSLAVGESDLAREIVQDPYDLDFLALDPGYTERELEDALVARMTHFFTELGDGFAFVGRQYRLPVGEQEFFIDLLFFHLGLRRYIVFELKAGRVEPGHLGTLNFYVNAVDDLLRRPEHGDGSTIGILLAADRDDVVVEYALRGFETPLAVSTYTTHRALPEEVRPALPSPDELAEVIRDVQRHHLPET